MRRWLVRICSFAFATVLFICSAQVVQGMQKLTPFDTDVAFNLNIVSSTTPKDDLAEQLASIGRKLDTTIVKISPDKTNYKSKRDVIFFSGSHSSHVGPIANDGKICWANAGVTGDIIQIDQIGDRTLNGEYNAIDTPGFRRSIQEWALSNAIEVEWSDRSNLTSNGTILSNMLRSATGLLLPACFLLILASVSSSLQKRWRQQKIELTEGKTYLHVRFESAASHILLVLEGLVTGLIAGLIFTLALDGGPQQAAILAKVCSGAAIILSIAMVASVALLSAASVPTFNELPERNPTPRILSCLGAALSFAGIVIVISAVSAACSGIEMQKTTLEQMDQFSRMPEATRISLLATAGGGGETDDQIFEDLASRAESDDEIMLAIDVNQAMALSASDLNGFDHFILANERYLEAIGIGIGQKGTGGTLTALKADEVPDIAIAQSKIWLDDGGGPVSFYRYEGPGVMSMGPNVGNGGKSVICHNPVVMIVDGDMGRWSSDRLVSPLLSTGNIFFVDYESAMENIEEAGASDLIASVDNIFELAMRAAQDIALQLQVLSASIVVSLALVVVMGFQSAASWSMRNARLIFALRSDGHRLPIIASEKLGAWVIGSILASSAGALMQIILLRHQPTPALIASGSVFVLITACQIAFRCWLASAQFRSTVVRG